jgi:glycosyltransferase involved in cell wall biosynthesis
MISTPKISVIIPVYNVAAYLEECLDSVVNQTLYDIEIIVVNDGSTDNSPDIIERYRKKDSRISVINKQNEGLILARKSGLEIAAGEYIYHLDSDDYIDSDVLEAMYLRAKETDADMVVGNYLLIFANKTVQVNIMKFDVIGRIEYIKVQLQTPFYVCTKLIKREFYKDILFLGHITRCEDVIITSQIITKINKISKIEKNILNYRQRSTSLAHIASKEHFISGYNAYMFCREHLEKQDFFKQIKSDFAFFYLKRISAYLINNGEHLNLYKNDIKLHVNKYFDDKEIRRHIKSKSKFLFFIYGIIRFNYSIGIFCTTMLRPYILIKRYKNKKY